MALRMAPLLMPPWVPAVAAAQINKQLADHAATPAMCGLLNRLATYEVMKTDVWEKLPAECLPSAGWVINSVCLAYDTAMAIKPPLPKRKEDWTDYIQKYPVQSSCGELASLAKVLEEGMKPWEPFMAHFWAEMWTGNPEVTPRKAMEFLLALDDLFKRLDVEARKLQALANLPPLPRKKGSLTVHETYFSQTMSGFFLERFGKPFDPVVTALTEVAFDQPGGSDTATIRGRRRRKRPED